MKLPKDDKLEVVRQVQQHFRDEFDFELGDLEAELLLEYFEKLLGPFAYNEAIADARAVVARRAETMDEELFGLTRQPGHGSRFGAEAQ
jgi:uncharacterized protein (DUF2164 family)